MTAVLAPTRPVLADRLSSTRTRDAVLVVGAALFVALCSQVQVPLGFTPVPINGLTFASMVVGGALGLRRGVSAMGLFWFAGLAGLPFYAGGGNGWEVAGGATGGYLIGAIAAAALMGFVAERGGDRRIATSVGAMLAANAVLIYVPGTLWLARVVDAPVFGGADSAFALGVAPFIVGDLLKLILAGLVLPVAWRLLGERD